MERVSEITRRNTLDGRATEPQQEGAMPGRELTGGVSQQDILEPQEQPESPAGASLETPLAGSQPLQPRGHSRLAATHAVTRADIAAKSSVRCNANTRSDSAHLAAITTGPALVCLSSEGRGSTPRKSCRISRMRRTEQTLPLNTPTPRRPFKAVRPGRMRTQLHL